jgi:hypothetical protein
MAVNKSRCDPNTDRGHEPTAASFRSGTAPAEGEMFGQTAPVIHTLVFAQFDWGLLFWVAFLATVFITVLLGASTPLVSVIAKARAGATKLRLKAELKQQVIALKQQMIEQGMTADEIVQVLGPPYEALDDLSQEEDDEPEEEDDKAEIVNEPRAGEVLIEQEGEWHTALVLRRDGNRYLIHTCPGCYGAEMSDNEWVDADRLRFPAPSSGQVGSPRGSADRTETFGTCFWCDQPKKEAVPAEV